MCRGNSLECGKATLKIVYYHVIHLHLYSKAVTCQCHFIASSKSVVSSRMFRPESFHQVFFLSLFNYFYNKL